MTSPSGGLHSCGGPGGCPPAPTIVQLSPSNTYRAARRRQKETAIAEESMHVRAQAAHHSWRMRVVHVRILSVCTSPVVCPYMVLMLRSSPIVLSQNWSSPEYLIGPPPGHARSPHLKHYTHYLVCRTQYYRVSSDAEKASERKEERCNRGLRNTQYTRAGAVKSRSREARAGGTGRS